MAQRPATIPVMSAPAAAPWDLGRIALAVFGLALQMVRRRRMLGPIGQHSEAVGGTGYRPRPPAGGAVPS